MQEKIKIVVSGAADLRSCCPNIKSLSEDIGKELAKQGAVLLTGATTGAPYYTAKGFKKQGGFHLGFSPAASKKEHIKTYRLPTEYTDLIV